MIAIVGRSTHDLGPDELAERRRGTVRVVVDVGTGDGRWAYAYARAHPDAFVVGIDALAANLAEVSRRASRKAARGGLPNVLFVRADAAAPPAELVGSADEVHVLLPWGKLLLGTMLARPPGATSPAGPGAADPFGEREPGEPDPGEREPGEPDPDVLRGVVSLAKPGGVVRIVFNGEVWEESTPQRLAGVAPVTVDDARRVLVPAYRGFGVEVERVVVMQPEEVAALGSTWARRLAASHAAPRFVEVVGRVAAGDLPARG